MSKAQLDDVMRNFFLNRHVEIQFTGSEKTRGLLQAWVSEGMILTHGEHYQFVPFNQVLTVREYTRTSE